MDLSLLGVDTDLLTDLGHEEEDLDAAYDYGSGSSYNDYDNQEQQDDVNSLQQLIEEVEGALSEHRAASGDGKGKLKGKHGRRKKSKKKTHKAASAAPSSQP